MILPSNETCVRVLKELAGDPALTQWQSDFIDSNLYRTTFTDKQRYIIAEMIQEFEV